MKKVGCEISSMSKEGRNGGNEYVSDLLDQILSRDKMMLTYFPRNINIRNLK